MGALDDRMLAAIASMKRESPGIFRAGAGTPEIFMDCSRGGTPPGTDYLNGQNRAMK
jgi:hypothetical protein